LAQLSAGDAKALLAQHQGFIRDALTGAAHS
ncbi:N-acetylmuramic acid 6-phosphate etherase, partial [Salmonella enterica subsp. enterica serovar Chester]|nr:N-acetylmuramic acid 6-phosphate etherase [Salmonella enterica subsp. enterica serovar Chester]